MKYIIGILIGFFLVWYFPIENEIDKAFSSANWWVESLMDSVDGNKDNPVSE
jgi:hypothetical protein|tara:strand:+ start:1661 stop:1816 length:156 start_codon:yes stop_codon:yes gene_type:complete